MTTELVNIARKLNRQLQLDKGMFFNADDLALLAAIGVNDVIQQKSSEYLKEQARMRSMRRGCISGGGPRLSAVIDDCASEEPQEDCERTHPEPKEHPPHRSPRVKSAAEEVDIAAEYARARGASRNRGVRPIGSKKKL